MLGCPFGVPKMKVSIDLMMKCDMCYDRTSVGKKPMCATVCPSEALYFGEREHIESHRREKPVNEFQFGNQTVRTKVNMMTAPEKESISIDVADLMPSEEDTAGEDWLEREGAPDVAAMAVWED